MVSEQQATVAVAKLRKIIEAAENSNQAGEDAAVMAAAAPDMAEALEGCQKMLAILIDPANKGSGINNMAAWAGCVAAEAKARAALKKARGE